MKQVLLAGAMALGFASTADAALYQFDFQQTGGDALTFFSGSFTLDLPNLVNQAVSANVGEQEYLPFPIVSASIDFGMIYTYFEFVTNEAGKMIYLNGGTDDGSYSYYYDVDRISVYSNFENYIEEATGYWTVRDLANVPAPVPLPAAGGLLLVGIGALGAARLRRKS